MTHPTRNPDDLLDDALDQVHGETLDEATAQAAVDRVWNRIVSEVEGPLRGCRDIQALIPAFVAGTLAPARAMLVDDHTKECVACRRALMEARSPRTTDAHHASHTARVVRFPRAVRLAAAAVVILGVGMLTVRAVGDLTADRNLRASVATVDGALQLVTADGSEPLAAGADVRSRQSLRTTKGSGALVQLADGSVIEMNERSQLAFRGSRSGTTIELERGNIIVHAADQRDGRLLVSTSECTVAVKGTIFAVNHGLKGSRVSVIEGEVEVRQRSDRAFLLPGDQLTTDERLRTVPVEDEIAWSRNADKHIALLRELTDLRREISAAVRVADHRSDTRLLGLAPPDTVMYAAIPNLTEGLLTARDVFLGRLTESPELASWWQENVAAHGIDTEIEDALDRLQPIGEAIGDEVVVTLPRSLLEGEASPLILAVLDDPEGFRSHLESEIADAEQVTGLRVIDDPLATSGEDEELLIWLTGDLMAASPDVTVLRDLAARLDDPLAPSFAGSELHARLSEAYMSGITWLFGLDLHALLETVSGDETETAMLDQLGLLDARTLVVEHHSEADRGSTQAELGFDGPRRGLAAWLAEPAPMGSLDFVSPQATLAVSLVAKDASVMFDELMTMLGSVDQHAVDEFQEAQARLGLDLRADLAAPLGGEAAFAVDGPLLPIPSWKLIVEVYDPATLQHTIEWAVEETNRELESSGEAPLVLTSEEAGGRTYHSLQHTASPLQVVYMMTDGFLIAAPNRALIDMALQYRDSNLTLAAAPSFRELLPDNGYTDCSALFYRNLGRLLETMPDTAAGVLPPAALELIRAGSAPALYAVFGDTDRIVLSGTGENLLTAPLLWLPGILGGDSLGEAGFGIPTSAVSSDG